MNKNSRILVLGSNGLVGSALVRALSAQGYINVFAATRASADLCNLKEVRNYFNKVLPEYIFFPAAKVGGIKANNSTPFPFILENLRMETNVIQVASELHFQGILKKFMFFGSSCIYPKFAEQPIKECSLMSGCLEPTNSAYAIAKIAGIELCESAWRQFDFNAIEVMPTNLFGINDNYREDSSHVIPGIIRKVISNESGNVELLGDGTPLREFLDSDTLAEICIKLMSNPNARGLVNIGSGFEITIDRLAHIIAEEAGIKITFSYPDKSKVMNGTPRKCLDLRLMNALLNEQINYTEEKFRSKLRESIQEFIRQYDEHDTSAF